MTEKPKQIESLQELQNLAENQKAVIGRFWKLPRPAEFVINQPAKTVLEYFNSGLFEYSEAFNEWRREQT
jgi:hypothetical protein